MIDVIVASKNPVKIDACQLGFQKVFPSQNFNFLGHYIDSGVSDQPMSDKETLKGALNRAANAKRLYPAAEYWVGIEGGIEELDQNLMAFAWIVILNKNKKGQARTAGFFLPPKVSDLIRDGIELGEADDKIFGQNNSKQKGGAIGLLTNNLIDRKGLYSEAIIMALIPFLRKDIY